MDLCASTSWQKVHPDQFNEYQARHRDLSPEMLDALRASGWRDYPQSAILAATGNVVVEELLAVIGAALRRGRLV